MPAIADTDIETSPAPRFRRRWLAAAVLLLLATGYALAPAVAAVRLLEAARAGDAEGVVSRVNFARLRRSLARQIVAEAMRARQLQGPERQLAIGAGTMAVAAWLEQLLSAEKVADLLGGRAVALDSNRGPVEVTALRLAPLGSAFQVWRQSGFTGPLSYAIVLARAGGPEAVEVGMELDWRGWRVASLALPPPLREELARQAAAIAGAAPTAAP